MKNISKSRHSENKVRIDLIVSKRIKERLQVEAMEKGIKISELIRRIVSDHIQKTEYKDAVLDCPPRFVTNSDSVALSSKHVEKSE